MLNSEVRQLVTKEKKKFIIKRCMNIKTIASVSVGLSLFIGTATTTLAVETNTTTNSEGKRPFIEKRCEMVENKVAEKINRFNSNKDGHIVRYNKMKDRISDVIGKLENRGYEVAKLKADLQTLDVKIKKFAEDYIAYINKLGETKNYACGNSEGNFKSKLEEARKLLSTLRDDEKDIRKFFQETVKTDVKSVREQKKAETK